MKSLNRTLSLVLVLAMVFGLMGVASANTSFTDDTSIQYQTAVGVMTGVGAINGLTDGSFNPKGTITREDAAKLICYAILGATVAKTLYVSATGFSDVAATRWSAPYITYLVSKGIINGNGDGTFAPTGNVTGYQLGKMLLCAAGYGKQGEYVGNAWSLNVAVDANRLGIYTGTKATSFNTAATREEAALYVFNGIQITKMVWTKASDSYIDDSTATTTAFDLYGYTGKKFDTSTPPSAVFQAISATYNATKKAVVVTARGADGTTNVSFVGKDSDVGNLFNLYMGKDSDGAAYVIFASALTYTIAAPAAGATASEQAVFNAKYTTSSDSKYDYWANYNKAGTQAAYALGSTLIVLPASSTDADGKDNIIAWTVPSFTIESLTVTANSAGKYTVKLGSTTLVDQTLATPVNKVTTTVDWSKYVATSGGVFQVKTFDGASRFEVYETSKVVGVPTALSSTGTYTVSGAAVAASSWPASGTVNAALSPVTPTIQSTTSTTPVKYTFYLDAQGKYFAVAGDTTVTESNVVYVTYDWPSKDTYGADVFNVQTVNLSGVIANYVTATDLNLTANTPYAVTVTSGVASFATITGDATVAKTVAATDSSTTLATGAVILTANHYLTENTVFYFVPIDGAPTFPSATLKNIVTKTGVSSVIGQTIPAGSVMYYANTTSANKTVSAVIVKGTYSASVSTANTSYVYVAATASLTSTVYGANFYNVCVDGVAKSLAVGSIDTVAVGSSTTLPAGFYTYTTLSGAALLTTVATGDYDTSGLIANSYVSNIYGNMISIAGSSAVTNKVFTSATVVDLRDPVAVVAAGGSIVKTPAELGALVAAAKIDGKLVNVSVTYSVATATLGVPVIIYVTATSPVITASAVSSAITATTATLTATASVTAGGTVAYAWYADPGTAGTRLGTLATLSLTGLTASTAYATYHCVVTSAGAATVNAVVPSFTTLA